MSQNHVAYLIFKLRVNLNACRIVIRVQVGPFGKDLLNIPRIVNYHGPLDLANGYPIEVTVSPKATELLFPSPPLFDLPNKLAKKQPSCPLSSSLIRRVLRQKKEAAYFFILSPRKLTNTTSS